MSCFLFIMTDSNACLVHFSPTHLQRQRRLQIYIDIPSGKQQPAHFITTISMQSTSCKIHNNYAVTKTRRAFGVSHLHLIKVVSISAHSSRWVLGLFVLVQNLWHIRIQEFLKPFSCHIPGIHVSSPEIIQPQPVKREFLGTLLTTNQN
jgi:hypothetical protein